jgi:ADP-heptose:LPS heptosyltransferase
LLKKPEVGIVGNLQIKHGGQWSETIDSAGSQWDWNDKSFLHIGKDIYDHHRIKQPLRPDYCPPTLLETQEREMVTGACLGIRKELYDEVGGFNPNYRIGYWEDADLCLTVREKGYKVMYQPNSKIYHKTHHSASGGHKYVDHNISYFHNKWVNSGRIDSLVESPRPTPFNAIRTILLKRSMAHGDVLLAAAVAPALKKKHPGCKIIFTTDCEEAIRGNPHIDRIIKSSEISERLFQVYYNLDMAYEYRPKTPLLQAYAEMCGVKESDCQLYLNTEPISGLPEKYVVFHCGNTQWAGRNWSPVKFEILANRIAKMGLSIVCVGEPPDHVIPKHVNFVGCTNIAQLAYIIQNALCFVGIDSFPMHVAQTFNTPGVCFFGSIRPETRIIRPNMKGVIADLPCIGCHHRKPTPCTSTVVCEKGIAECINMITVDNLLKEVEKILVDKGVPLEVA